MVSFNSPTNNSDEISRETIVVVVGTEWWCMFWYVFQVPRSSNQWFLFYTWILKLHLVVSAVFYFSIVSLIENFEWITNGIWCSWHLIGKLIMLLINLCNFFVNWIRDMFAAKFQIRNFRAALFVCVHQDICDISYFNGVWCFAFM